MLFEYCPDMKGISEHLQCLLSFSLFDIFKGTFPISQKAEAVADPSVVFQQF